MRSIFKFSFLFFLLIALSGCNKDGSSRIVVRMVDSPGDFEAVYVDIQDVEVNVDDSWLSLNATAGTYDLLELTGGVDALLADTEIPSGSVSQLRLILGDQNSVIISGKEYSLTTPSAQQSGLKVQINQNFDDGITYSILLDFDAARSVVSTGSGKYNLKPVIRSIVEARTGALFGTVIPAEENVAVYIKFNGTALATTYAAEDSENWTVGGIDPGTYTVEFDPGDDSLYKTSILENVEVTAGEKLDLGEVVLELK